MKRSSKVEANQSTAFDKRIISNKNTSVQSRLGEHGPLRSVFGCQLLNFFFSSSSVAPPASNLHHRRPHSGRHSYAQCTAKCIELNRMVVLLLIANSAD